MHMSVYRIVPLRHEAVVHPLLHPEYANYNSHTAIIPMISTELVCVSTEEFPQAGILWICTIDALNMCCCKYYMRFSNKA